MSIEDLKKTGINFRTHHYYSAEDQDRNGKEVKEVQLALTPKQWFELCTRDGRDYIGGCCGNTSAVQDILCSAFRDSGWIDGADLFQIYQLLSDHEGFESMKKPKKNPRTWYDKLAAIWVASQDTFTPVTSSYLDPVDFNDPKRVLHALRNGLFTLDWDLIMSSDQDFQKHGNRELLLSRIAPQLKFVNEKLSEFGFGPFDGFALVEGGTETMLTNRMGLCLFDSIDKAREVLSWSVRGKDYKVDIRRCRVSMEDGLKMGDLVE